VLNQIQVELLESLLLSRRIESRPFVRDNSQRKFQDKKKPAQTQLKIYWP
jgi:hypothetical protein